MCMYNYRINKQEATKSFLLTSSIKINCVVLKTYLSRVWENQGKLERNDLEDKDKCSIRKVFCVHLVNESCGNTDDSFIEFSTFVFYFSHPVSLHDRSSDYPHSDLCKTIPRSQMTDKDEEVVLDLVSTETLFLLFLHRWLVYTVGDLFMSGSYTNHSVHYTSATISIAKLSSSLFTETHPVHDASNSDWE